MVNEFGQRAEPGQVLGALARRHGGDVALANQVLGHRPGQSHQAVRLRSIGGIQPRQRVVHRRPGIVREPRRPSIIGRSSRGRRGVGRGRSARCRSGCGNSRPRRGWWRQPPRGRGRRTRCRVGRDRDRCAELRGQDGQMPTGAGDLLRRYWRHYHHVLARPSVVAQRLRNCLGPIASSVPSAYRIPIRPPAYRHMAGESRPCGRLEPRLAAVSADERDAGRTGHVHAADRHQTPVNIGLELSWLTVRLPPGGPPVRIHHGEVKAAVEHSRRSGLGRGQTGQSLRPRLS